MRFWLFLSLLLLPSLAQAQNVRVLTSIAPLGGIAAAVMEGAGQPDVLIPANASPHTYQMKPSDAAKLEAAQIVLWVGPGLENFLERPLAALAPNAKRITLGESASLEHLSARAGGLWEEENGEEAEEEHHHHDHGSNDPHLWLDPRNAIKIAALLSAVLSEQDPAHAPLYQANLARFTQRLTALDRELDARLAPVKTRPFIVFHDAYQYFQHHYGLNGVGAITLSPEEQPSATRLAALRARIAAQQIQCLYAEPQFSPAVLTTLQEGSKVGTGTLNPDASDLPINADLYPAYLSRLVQDFLACAPNP